MDTRKPGFRDLSCVCRVVSRLWLSSVGLGAPVRGPGVVATVSGSDSSAELEPGI